MGDTVRAIVALGNPGRKYAGDRHNAGFWLADALAAEHRLRFSREKRFQSEMARLETAEGAAWLAKPWTYMNRVGESVAPLTQFYGIATTQVLVVHDELDLPAGAARFKAGGGHGGHNGLRDVTRVIGADFKRLRLGIGHPGPSADVLGHVLGRPGKNERAEIDRAIGEGLAAIDVLLAGGWDKAAQSLNTKT